MWRSVNMAVRTPKFVMRDIQLRRLARASPEYKKNLENKMQAWQIHSYGGLDELKLTNARIPMISRPADVLIKVEASSVNPIDLAMCKGYGSTVINLMRRAKSLDGGTAYSDVEFPLTLGRDFTGVVVAKGHGVGSRLNLGDLVWGVIPIDQQGCHANYVTVDDNLVNPRPQNLSYTEAAGILYAGLTAWSALWLTGNLCCKRMTSTQADKKVLVLGGSGGVGTLAVQLLKAWNVHVITTCSSDALNLLEKLGADVAIDYKHEDADWKIFSEGPYDIILDCCNQGPDLIKSKGYPHRAYVTLNSPLLKNIDQHGLIGGMARNVGNLLRYNVPRADDRGSVKWAFFTPSRAGINVLQDLVESGKVTPVLEKVYSFNELPRAYERVSSGHLRGKIVIDMK